MVSLWQGSLGCLIAQYLLSKRTRLNVLIQPLLVMLANALPAEARLVAQGCEDGRHGSSGTPSLSSGS